MKTLYISVTESRVCEVTSYCTTDVDLDSTVDILYSYALYSSEWLSRSELLPIIEELRAIISSKHEITSLSADGPYVDLSNYLGRFNADKTKEVMDVLTGCFGSEYEFAAAKERDNLLYVYIPQVVHVNVSLKAVHESTSSMGNTSEAARFKIVPVVTFDSMINSEEILSFLKHVVTEGMLSPASLGSRRGRFPEEGEGGTESATSNGPLINSPDLTDALIAHLNGEYDTLPYGMFFKRAEERCFYELELIPSKEPGFWGRIFGRGPTSERVEVSSPIYRKK